VGPKNSIGVVAEPYHIVPTTTGKKTAQERMVSIFPPYVILCIDVGAEGHKDGME